VWGGGGDGSGQDPHGREDDDGAVADVEDEEVVEGPVEEGYLLRRRQMRQVQVADLRVAVAMKYASGLLF